jgi:uncharacterized membrane protein YfcA
MLSDCFYYVCGMQVYEYALIIGVGLFAGFLNVVAGGGSLITLPILIFLGLPAPIANATNRVALVFQNISAVSGFHSKGVRVSKYSLFLGLAAIPGAVIGAIASTKLEGELFNRIIAIVMIGVIIITFFSPNKSVTNIEEKIDRKHQIIGAITFFFIGLYGGFIQAGVGFLIMASLTNINHLSLVKTNAIKVFVVFIYTIAALAIFIWKGAINWQYGLCLAVGNSTGAWMTSRWSVKVPEKIIKRILAITVTGLAIKLWFYS